MTIVSRKKLISNLNEERALFVKNAFFFSSFDREESTIIRRMDKSWRKIDSILISENDDNIPMNIIIIRYK